METTAKCISLGPADCRERLSYSVRRSDATFQRVISHVCESLAGSGIRTGGQLSLEEGGHRGGPSSRQRVRVLQPVLRCSKEGWEGLRPILDMRLLNHSVRRLKFRMLTVKQVAPQIRSEDWFVTIDLKDAYFHIHPSQSQEVPEVRFQGQSLLISGSSFRPNTLTPNFHEVRGCCPGSSATPGHPHTQLRRRLVDFSSFRADGGSTSRCRSRSDERVGVKTKCKEKCAVSITENHLSWRGVGFDHDAGTVVPCSDRVDSHHSQESQRRPKGKPVPHDQGHAAMPTCLGHVEETLVLVSGPGPGSSLPPRNASNGCIPDRLWAVMSGHPARGLWSGHHLTWHINCLEMLAVFRALKHFLPDLRNHNVLVRTDNTAVVSFINHQGGLRFYKLLQAFTSWRTRSLCGPRTSSSR